jgi:protoporphyrinogen oxidase
MDSQPQDSIGIAVLGAGPAGLTGARVLARAGRSAVVFEAEAQVGGIAKTIEFEGYRFDLGGHRFYTKLRSIQRLWEESLGEELLVRKRMSRIYYRGRFFNYPLRAEDIFRRLGLIESLRCALSYAGARLRFWAGEPKTLEDWVVSRFGRRIYEDFFSTYTKKVWGVPGSEIQAEWAAQRIQEFSLLKALLGIMRLQRRPPPTAIEQFHYPRLGPGQMWEAFQEGVEADGIPVRLQSRCVGIGHDAGRVRRVVIDRDGELSEHTVDGVVSTLALPELIYALDPPPPPAVRDAARSLSFRNLCLVALMLEDEVPFPDNWIYLHDPATTAGRVQNFGAWSEGMVRRGTACLGVEYFCGDGDEIWGMSDADAVSLAVGEMEAIGLIDASLVTNGVKVRVPRAYPVYDDGYREAVAEIRGYLQSFENLQTCGRNGLHRYNNQDHSMWTAALATTNLLDGGSRDVWSINSRGEYLERPEQVELELEGLGAAR